ncbi:MAG: hypothetical protein HUU20_04085 [Pirellulales bacterium]|nr:hypothetical protein [Pirellulales bacterium]
MRTICRLRSGGSGLACSLAGVLLLGVYAPFADAAWHARSWLADSAADKLPRLNDGDDFSVVVVPVGKDFGLETETPTRIGRLAVRYVSLHGHFLQPEPRSAPVEIWRDNRWQKLDADVKIDYSEWNSLAAYQGYGTVTWTYRFAPVETTRIRVLVQQSDGTMRYAGRVTFRGALVREVVADALEPIEGPVAAAVQEIGRPRLGTGPAVSSEGECLTDPVYQPGIQKDADAVAIEWPRKRILSMVRLALAGAPAKPELAVAWWDGSSYRPVEAVARSTAASDANTIQAHFLPVATQRIRILHPSADVVGVEAFLDKQGQDNLRSAEQAADDALGIRILKEGEPDWPRTASMILPADFLKGFTGRPDDVCETMLNWDGTLIWRVGEGPQTQRAQERWLAFAMDGESIGRTPEEISRQLVDGWMPGVEYRIRRPQISGRMTVFTTAASDANYADRIHWELRAVSGPRDVQLDVILGERLAMPGFYEKNAAGDAHPAIYAPAEVPFQLRDDRRTVVDDKGSVVLWSSEPGEFAGSSRERRLRVSLALRHDQATALDLVLPHVDAPTSDSASLARVPLEQSLQGFRDYWREQVASAAQFVVPEPAVNDAVQNALCQCLIIPDQGVPHYGAHWYEWCIGLEECWPTIALAQMGRAEEAKKHAAAMVDHVVPESSHHFPYVNSLSSWAAAEVALLTGDLPWYRGLVDKLKERSEWTIRSAAEDNRGTPYHGLVRKFGYGGDVHAPAHSLYNNVTCWRGLRDTGRVLRLLGDEETASRYLREAEALRASILRFWEAKIDRAASPPFVPFAFDIGYPDKRDSYAGTYSQCESAYERLNTVNLGNYWNLFMQILLELQFHPDGRPEPGWIQEYASRHGGVTLGLARFRDGVDWHYGVGYIKSLLWSGRRDEFLLSFYGALAHGAAGDVRTSPEDCSIWPARTSNIRWRDEFDVARWSFWSGWDEALSASPGVVLQLVRMMLVEERFDADGENGTLVLLSGIPRKWLEDGKQIRIERAPTHFGPIEMQVVSHVAEGRIDVEVKLQPRREIQRLAVKLFHPQGRPVRSASLNGSPIQPSDGETIAFSPEGSREFRIVAEF